MMAVLNLYALGWFTMHQVIIYLLIPRDKCFCNNIKIGDTGLAPIMGRGWEKKKKKKNQTKQNNNEKQWTNC